MKKWFKLSMLTCFALLLIIESTYAQGQSIVGKWQSIDEDNKPTAIVNIFENQGKYYGNIIELFREADEDPNPVCDKCSDDDPRKNQPVLGMQIIKDMVKDGDQYKDGTVLDANNGKVYDCKMWVEDGVLQVRGYLFFFFRTQTWQKAE